MIAVATFVAVWTAWGAWCFRATRKYAAVWDLALMRRSWAIAPWYAKPGLALTVPWVWLGERTRR